MNYLTTYNLSDLYELSSGISSEPSQAGHGFPFCSFSTIFNNHILPEVLPDSMDTTEEEREKYSIKAGDVLLTRTSETLDELAMTSVALKDYPDATFSGFAKRLRPISDKTYPKFMAHFLRSTYFRTIINNKAVMTLRASFNENIFNDISFDLPPIEDQIKAGDFLYDLELKVRNNNDLANDFKELIDTMFNYWFVQYNYENIENHDLVWNENANYDVPEEWYVLKIRDLIESEIGGDWGKDSKVGNYVNEVTCIRGTDITSIINGTDTYLPTRYILDKNMSKILKVGDYVIEVSGTPGRSTYINEQLIERYSKSLIASNFCCAFSLKNKEMLYWFDSIWKRLYENGTMKNFSGKTTIANLLFDSMADSVYVAIPPMEILVKYNYIVEPMFQMIQNLYDENKRLRDLRNYITDFFMTGQVKIR